MNESAQILVNPVDADFNSERKHERNLFLKYAGLLSVIPILWVLLYLSGKGLCKRGDMADSDCYLRLLRVEALHDGGPWYDPVVPRINPPYGQTSHWTRPFDVLLLLGALPISLFTDFRTALFWWGVVSGPVLMFATIIALQWATRPILGRKGSLAVGFLYLGQTTLWACFQPGRPDHQTLLILLFALSIGLTLRMIVEPLDSRVCCMAGAVSALAMWVSVESMAPIGIALVVLGALWVLKKGDFVRTNLYYAVSLFVGVGVGLIIERSPHMLLAEEYDRLSIVHFSLFEVIALLWTAIFILDSRIPLFGTRTKRLLSVPACAAFVALAMWLLFPGFFRGPFSDLDPRLIPIYQQKIAELIPLVRKSDLLIVLVQIATSFAVCVPLLAYLLFKTGQNGKRGGWVYIFLVAALFGSAAIFQYTRWAYYAQTAVVIPMTGLMNRALVWRQFKKNEILKAFRNILVKLLFVFGPLSLGIAAQVLADKSDKPHHEIRMEPFCEYLNTQDRWQGRQLRILADLFEGAEIIYRTPHEVMATPHATGTPSRNGQGILDTYDIMTAGTDQEALELIHKRGIDLIVLRPKSGEPEFYSRPDKASTFYQRLCEDKTPDWLHKVELPSNLSESFLLFEVTGK